MASFWKNKPEAAVFNDKKDALENIISSGTSCTITKAKIKQADALNSRNDLEKAYKIYKDILVEDTGHADALFGIGTILEKQQKLDLAIQFLSKAIDSNPGKIQALLTRGRILRLQGLSENAISDFTEIISKHPDNFEALIARGITFGQIGQLNMAIDDFNTSIKINPNIGEAFYNRGVAYEKLQEFDAAIGDYSLTLKHSPRNYKAYNNRGVAWREIKRFDAAIKDFDKCVEINPDFAEGYYNKSLTLLSVGNLKEGFKLYEHRWKTDYFQSQVRHFSQPLWLGDDDLTDKTILLHSEQGLGDSIQFCRYIKLFKSLKCEVLLEIERPLMTLMQSLLPEDKIFEKGGYLPSFDFHCPIMSLPHAFLTNENTIPIPWPYLSARKPAINYWKRLLGPKKKIRVGISWKGNKSHKNDHKRSIPLTDIINELDDEFEWVSLQYALSNDEITLIQNNKNIRHYGSRFKDFAMTAALCENLDAVVSVDTSVGHLAGSLGKKTLLLLSDMPDARWQMYGSFTPWYKNTILVRQKDRSDWAHPIQEAKKIIRTSQK